MVSIEDVHAWLVFSTALGRESKRRASQRPDLLRLE
jgi:hypothetical protein